MKFISKTFLLSLLVVFTASIYAQDSWYGGQKLSGPWIDTQTSMPGESNENRPLPVPQNDKQSAITPPLSQTDEYGYFNFNAYCSGFTGTEWIAVPNNPSFYNETFDGSVEMWVFPTSFTGSGTTLMSLGATANKGFGWYVQSTGQFTFRIGSTELTHTGTAVPLNTWTHVAVTWTGGGPYTVTFYVNGAQSGSPLNIAGPWNSTTDSLRIGRDQAFTTSAFHGSIDEVRFWGDIRTAAEIRENRFVGIGDDFAANTGNALTSGSAYELLLSSWNFNTSNNPTLEFINGKNGYLRGPLSQIYSTYAPQPMAYNFACLFPDGANDYLVIPDNAIFDQTFAGSIEAWIYMNAAGQLNTIFQKGGTFSTTTLAFYITAGDKVGINIGPHNYISSGPATFVANRWYHVAATWSGGPNFTVNLYVNGVLDNTQTFNGAMPTNPDPAWIGRYYSTTGNFNGYIDEVRLWNNARTTDQIRQNMFASGRQLLPNTALVGLWNFDGNLINRSATSGIDASLNSGGVNNSRLSAFRNENLSGELSASFVAHATVINRLATNNPFPAGYIVKPVNKPINDNQTTRDTIFVSGSSTLTSVELLIAARHTYTNDLDITLRAPNGQTRDICSDNGGTGEDVLTIFLDGATPVTTTDFFAPWSHIAAPEVAMGTMGGTNIQGAWIIEVADDLGGDNGTFIGWGLRFNGATTAIQPITNNIPSKFNLYQNYPNPFNPVSNIKFDIAKSSNVKLVVYDMLGREVKTLVNEFTQAGQYEVPFNGANLASGTYFFRIEAGDFTDVKKMILVK